MIQILFHQMRNKLAIELLIPNVSPEKIHKNRYFRFKIDIFVTKMADFLTRWPVFITKWSVFLTELTISTMVRTKKLFNFGIFFKNTSIFEQTEISRVSGVYFFLTNPVDQRRLINISSVYNIQYYVVTVRSSKRRPVCN